MDDVEIDSGNFGGNTDMDILAKDLEFYRCQALLLIENIEDFLEDQYYSKLSKLPEQVKSVISAYLGNKSSRLLVQKYVQSPSRNKDFLTDQLGVKSLISSSPYEFSEDTDEKFYILNRNSSIMSQTDPASKSDLLPETCPDDAPKESNFDETPCCSSSTSNIMQVSEKTSPEETQNLLVKKADDIDVRGQDASFEVVEIKKVEMSEKMLNQYANQVQAIILKTKCSFCGSFPKPPVLSCLKGHKICQICSEYVPNCPNVDEATGKICHKGITETQCRLLQAVFESGTFQCTSKGCRKKLNGPEMIIHAKICPFRPEYHCIVSNCKVTDLMTENHLPIHIIHGHNIRVYKFGPEYRQIPWLMVTPIKKGVIDPITKKRVYKEPDMFIAATFIHDGLHFFLFIAEMGRKSFPWVAVAEKLPEDKKYWIRINAIFRIDGKEKKYSSLGPVHHYSKPLKEILDGAPLIDSIRKQLSPLPMRLESPYSTFKMSVEVDAKEFSPPPKLLVTEETLALLSQIKF